MASSPSLTISIDTTPAVASHQSSAADDAVPQLATSGALVLLASVFGNGLNHLFGMNFARALGPVDFGIHALGMTVFNIVVLFAPLAALEQRTTSSGRSDSCSRRSPVSLRAK